MKLLRQAIVFIKDKRNKLILIQCWSIKLLLQSKKPNFFLFFLYKNLKLCLFKIVKQTKFNDSNIYSIIMYINLKFFLNCVLLKL